MKDYYNIKEVAELLQIPASTLRYWDEEGLIHTERDLDNNYRKFLLSTVIELSTISFYRNLGISIKELKHIFTSDLGVQKSLLEKEEQKIKQQIQDMYRQQKRIAKQKHLLQEVEQLKSWNICEGMPEYSEVEAFEWENPRQWEYLTKEPERFMLVLEGAALDNMQYGVGLNHREERGGRRILWKRESGKKYLESLLVVNCGNEKNNNMADILQEVKKLGYQPKSASAQYISSGWEENAIDYYRLWIEAEELSSRTI